MTLDQFFTLCKRILRRYQHYGEGILMIRCERCLSQQNRGFKLSLRGTPIEPLYLTQSELQLWKGQQVDRLHHLEASVLKLLEESGYGSLECEVKQHRNRCFVTVSLTFSYRLELH